MCGAFVGTTTLISSSCIRRDQKSSSSFTSSLLSTVSSPFTYDPRTPLPWALSGCSFPTTAATQITAKKQHSNRICHNSSFHTVNVALIYWLLHGRVDRWHSHLSCSHAAIDNGLRKSRCSFFYFYFVARCKILAMISLL